MGGRRDGRDTTWDRQKRRDLDAKIKKSPRGCRVGRDSWHKGKVGTFTVAARIESRDISLGLWFGYIQLRSVRRRCCVDL